MPGLVFVRMHAWPLETTCSVILLLIEYRVALFKRTSSRLQNLLPNAQLFRTLAERTYYSFGSFGSSHFGKVDFGMRVGQSRKRRTHPDLVAR